MKIFNQTMDSIHKRYICYANQSETQKDLTKTDYTYAKSWSYGVFAKRKGVNMWDWDVPNMSRNTINFFRNSIEKKSKVNELKTHSKCHKNLSLKQVNAINDLKEPKLSFRQTFRHFGPVLTTLLVIFAAILFSKSFEVSGQTSKSSSIVSEVFSSGYSSYGKGFESLVDVFTHYISIPLRLSSDMLSIHSCNELFDELKAIKYDLQTLKLSNNEIKQNLKSNENNENEKYFQLNNKIEKIEDFLFNFEEKESKNIKKLINEVINTYINDRTGSHDFALESAGGTVIYNRCSQSYNPSATRYEFFGIPLWISSVSPSAVIQPSLNPGECWAFKGSTGHLVIKLSQVITPSAFSYEHIPKQISRDGSIGSAPKQFQVRGLEDENDFSGYLLGVYVYEDNDIALQVFEVQHLNPKPIQYIEIMILSNHGHNHYTCLYRFKVHGMAVRK